eukprot:Nk52_evm38s222 gene=Nk52_evmTU38s222
MSPTFPIRPKDMLPACMRMKGIFLLGIVVFAVLMSSISVNAVSIYQPSIFPIHPEKVIAVLDIQSPINDISFPFHTDSTTGAYYEMFYRETNPPGSNVKNSALSREFRPVEGFDYAAQVALSRLTGFVYMIIPNLTSGKSYEFRVQSSRHYPKAEQYVSVISMPKDCERKGRGNGGTSYECREGDCVGYGCFVARVGEEIQDKSTWNASSVSATLNKIAPLVEAGSIPWKDASEVRQCLIELRSYVPADSWQSKVDQFFGKPMPEYYRLRNGVLFVLFGIVCLVSYFRLREKTRTPLLKIQKIETKSEALENKTKFMEGALESLHAGMDTLTKLVASPRRSKSKRTRTKRPSQDMEKKANASANVTIDGNTGEGTSAEVQQNADTTTSNSGGFQRTNSGGDSSKGKKKPGLLRRLSFAFSKKTKSVSLAPGSVNIDEFNCNPVEMQVYGYISNHEPINTDVLGRAPIRRTSQTPVTSSTESISKPKARRRRTGSDTEFETAGSSSNLNSINLAALRTPTPRSSNEALEVAPTDVFVDCAPFESPRKRSV